MCSARVALAEAAEQLRHAPRAVVLCGCRGEGEAGGGGAKRGHSKPAKVGQFVLFISIRLFSLQSFVLNTYRYLSLTVVACLCFQCCGTEII